MAIGPLCIPTLREDVLRLRQAEILEDADVRRLELLARDAIVRAIPDSPARRARARHTLRHWPMRPAQIH